MSDERLPDAHVVGRDPGVVADDDDAIDEIDLAPGVAADEPPLPDDVDPDVASDLRQRGEADAPVEYTDESPDQDERVAEVMGEATESPEAQAAADPAFDAPSADPDPVAGRAVDLEEMIGTVSVPSGPEAADDDVVGVGDDLEDVEVEDTDDLDDLLAVAGAGAVESQPRSDAESADIAVDEARTADRANAATARSGNGATTTWCTPTRDTSSGSRPTWRAGSPP
jgi:hypothetical protein